VNAGVTTTGIELAGETLHLLPEKALYWPRENTLFIADAHFGKTAAFRAAGIPLPPGSTTSALSRLNECIARTGAGRVVFLGDFLHSKDARAKPTFDRFAEWRSRHAPRDLLLVRGNHDAHAGDPPAEWNMRCVDEGEILGPFCLSHHPEPDLRGYVLAGHIHPSVSLHGPANDSLRLPCFWFGAYVCVLPAFGEFTGTCTVRPRAGDRVFVTLEGTVVEVAGFPPAHE
jgi:DNA ligase-associated metallophosphoesterase